MIKIPYEQLVLLIQTEKNLSLQDIEQLIAAKMEQLSGLLSKEGAAHILANELGVKINPSEGNVKINKLLAGMRNITLIGKVLRRYDIREFQSGERKGKVGSFLVADETGTIRVTCWHEQTGAMEALQENDLVKIEHVLVRENRGALELHFNDQSTLTKNPEGEAIGEIKQQTPGTRRKSINELQETDVSIELLGTIVQVFEPKFYPCCPQCRRKVQEQAASQFHCQAHGAIQPEYAYVLNLYLDDGTGTIRAVFFAQQMQQLLKKTDAEVQAYRTAPEHFGNVKTHFLGEMVKVIGKVVKNKFFEQTEFIVSSVNTKVNPEEEIARLQAEVEKGVT